MNSLSDYVLVYGGVVVTGMLMVVGMFAIDHADRWLSKRHRLAGARTQDLKRVERELDEVRRELRKRTSTDA